MKIDSERLRKLRLAQNWSQEQLAEFSGLSLRTVQRIENGSNASLESVRLLAKALTIETDELVEHEQDERRSPWRAVHIGLAEFSNFSDSTTRYDYWWFFLFALIIVGLAAIIHERAYQIVGLILLIPLVAAGTRRLNDTGRSGWWQLLMIVPFGQIVVFFLLAQASETRL